ncbi:MULTISPECIES: DUF4133 domain-containing protein [Chitinophaga]|uniref:DUF4133 domain-containing protein n=1 Tax=Chitinophaga pollutisoli TaxID=3133966 RepID=A0ABZ2YLR4_9BACT|nr:DUF4133 domain-containing protein [Chitinophaga rhizosphaerae]
MATVYQINKGVNRSIEFRGIKAQYLLFLAVGMVLLLLLCAIAFIAGIPAIPVVVAVVVAGYGLLVAVQRYSKRYGEHGLAKKLAQSRLPQHITTSSRSVFTSFNSRKYEKE